MNLERERKYVKTSTINLKVYFRQIRGLLSRKRFIFFVIITTTYFSFGEWYFCFQSSSFL